MEDYSFGLIFFFCKKDPHFFCVSGLCTVHGRGTLAEDVSVPVQFSRASLFFQGWTAAPNM